MLLYVILFAVFNLLGLTIIVWWIHKKLSAPIVIERRSQTISLENDVREGVKAALREMEYEKEMKQKISDTNNRRGREMGIYTSNDGDTKIKNSKGELVQFGMSEEEKQILNMFYND